MSQYRVLIDTQDEKGLVYKISKVFWRHNLNMLSNSEFVDLENNKFFMRSVLDGDINAEELMRDLQGALPQISNIRVIKPGKKNIILMVTKESHALGDILMRYEPGELEANMLAVVSNYSDLKSLVERFSVPFFFVSHEGKSREDHEAEITSIFSQFDNIDYIVLAKYMRVLTSGFVGLFADKIINIHHSFLPAFKGASPYRQAHARGVKIIGATAHFVNEGLDEGPIIAQETKHIDHAYSWRDLRLVGRDVEKIVLSRALKLALEDRIFVFENRTVIL